METPVEPFAGDNKTGAAGIPGRVVKFQIEDQGDGPPAFMALTLQ